MQWFNNLSFSKRLNLVMIVSVVLLAVIFLAASYQRHKSLAMRLAVERLRLAAGMMTEQIATARTDLFPEAGTPSCYNPDELQKQIGRIAGHRRTGVRLVSYGSTKSVYVPDTFEAQQMRWLKDGRVPETTIIVSLKDQKSILYMKSLVVRDQCLGCHGTYDSVSPEIREYYPAGSRMFNHKAGQVIGAIAITLPLAPLSEALKINLFHDLFALVLGGLLLILVLNIFIHHQLLGPLGRLTPEPLATTDRKLTEAELQVPPELRPLARCLQMEPSKADRDSVAPG